MLHFSGIIALIILITALIWFFVGWNVSGIERAKQQRNRETEWNHQLNTLRRDRDAFRDQVEIAHGKIRVLENRRADGKSPPRSPEDEAASRALTERLQKHLEQAKEQISGFARKVDTLREQSIEREDVLAQLRKKLTETSRALHDRDQKLAELNGGESDDAIAPVAGIATDERITRYEETIQQMRVEAQTRADAAEQDRQRLDHTISEHMQTIGALRAELARRDRQGASDDAAGSSEDVAQLRKEVETLRKENAEHVAKIEQLSQGSKVVEHQRTRLRELQTEYDEQRIVLEKLAQTADEHEAEREKLSEVEARSRAQQHAIEELKAERDEVAQALEAAQRQLREEQDAAESARSDEQEQLIARHERTIARIREESAERELQHDSELREMREAMEAQERIVSQLREVLSKPSLNVPKVAARPETPPAPVEPPPRSGDLFAPVADDSGHDSTTSPNVQLYEQPPASADDLKLINGIGPAFERALNDLGLFEFRQIAALSEGDIEWIARSLRSFPDRIVNGRWIEQAQNLIAENRSAGD